MFILLLPARYSHEMMDSDGAHWGEPADAQKRANYDAANKMSNQIHVAVTKALLQMSYNAFAKLGQDTLEHLWP